MDMPSIPYMYANSKQLEGLLKDHKMADTHFNRLEQAIKRAEADLKENQQLLVLYCDRSGQLVQVLNLGYHNPYLIVLHGIDSVNNKCTVLAHMESLELVIKIISLENSHDRRTIGFTRVEEGDQDMQPEPPKV